MGIYIKGIELPKDCDFQRTMDLYGDEQIDKPGWLRWEQDVRDEIERRNSDVRR